VQLLLLVWLLLWACWRLLLQEGADVQLGQTSSCCSSSSSNGCGRLLLAPAGLAAAAAAAAWCLAGVLACLGVVGTPELVLERLQLLLLLPHGVLLQQHSSTKVHSMTAAGSLRRDSARGSR
jgi:hypothetical protein